MEGFYITRPSVVSGVGGKHRWGRARLFARTFYSKCVVLEFDDDKLLWVSEDCVATVKVVVIVARVTRRKDGTSIPYIGGATYCNKINTSIYMF